MIAGSGGGIGEGAAKKLNELGGSVVIIDDDQAKIDLVVKAQPTGKISSPKDIAPVVAFFTSDDTSCVTGQTFYFCRCKSLFANIA
jgi:NAD(P)-dependent dehydrogenase (short-subunit alcohol dehydrogenase family)